MNKKSFRSIKTIRLKNGIDDPIPNRWTIESLKEKFGDIFIESSQLFTFGKRCDFILGNFAVTRCFIDDVNNLINEECDGIFYTCETLGECNDFTMPIKYMVLKYSENVEKILKELFEYSDFEYKIKRHNGERFIHTNIPLEVYEQQEKYVMNK